MALSRIGKLPIAIPAGTEATLNGNVLTVKGKLGTLSQDFHGDVVVKIEDGHIFVSPANIEKASAKLEEIIEPTPYQYNAHFSEKYGCNVFLKREDLQRVRSYKIRGAYNKISSIAPDVLRYGIVCASAGNHAQGVAFSCNKLKILGSIYMPVTTPRQKIEAVNMFGKQYVDIVLTGDTFDEANEAAQKYAARCGKTFIPPFDDEKIIEGQGTIG